MSDALETPPSEQPGAAVMAEPRKLGQLLSDSLDLAFERLGAYAAVVVLGLVPGVIVAALALALLGLGGEDSIKAALEAGDYASVAMLGGLSLVGLMFRALAYVALSLMLIARIEGRELGVSEAFGESLAVVGPLLAAYSLVALWVVGGLILLLIPGLILAIRYSMTHWAVLIEHKRGSEALARSKEIVVAHMGKVVGNLFVAGLATALVSGALVLGLLLALALVGLAKPDAIAGRMAVELAKELVQGIIGIWSVAFAALLYKDLAALHPAVENTQGAAS